MPETRKWQLRFALWLGASAAATVSWAVAGRSGLQPRHLDARGRRRLARFLWGAAERSVAGPRPLRHGKEPMSDDPKRPILVLLTSHWISLMGVALVTTAGFSWLFVLPIQLPRPHQQSVHRHCRLYSDSGHLRLRPCVDRPRGFPCPAAHRARAVGGSRPANLHSEACDFLRRDYHH